MDILKLLPEYFDDQQMCRHVGTSKNNKKLSSVDRASRYDEWDDVEIDYLRVHG